MEDEFEDFDENEKDENPTIKAERVSSDGENLTEIKRIGKIIVGKIITGVQ